MITLLYIAFVFSRRSKSTYLDDIYSIPSRIKSNGLRGKLVRKPRQAEPKFFNHSARNMAFGEDDAGNVGEQQPDNDENVPEHFDDFNEMYVSSTVIPIIASLKVPDIGSVIDLIKASFRLIYAEVDIAVKAALTTIKPTVVKFTAGVAADIETLVTEENATLKATVIAEFNAIVADVVSDIADITKKENTDTSSLVTTSNANLINQLKQRLASVESAMEVETSKGLKAVISEVTTAFTNAYNDVYSQIVALLANLENINAIVPQLFFINPKTISELLESDSNEVYLHIEAFINGALADMEVYIDATSEQVIKDESIIPKDANDAIITALNARVNEGLVVIKQMIVTTTNNNITKVENLITNSINGLSKAIDQVITELAPIVVNIVNIETTIMVSAVVALITRNNQSIADQVSIILDTK